MLSGFFTQTPAMPRIRLRSVGCSALFCLMLIAWRNVEPGLNRMLFRDHRPLPEAQTLGLAPLGSTWFDPWTSELRIWIRVYDVYDQDADRGGALLRLRIEDGQVAGGLASLPQRDSGLPPRWSTEQRDWAALVHELEIHRVWDLRERVSSVLCTSSSELIVESYRNGTYRRVDIPNVADLDDERAIRDAKAIADVMFEAARHDQQIASLLGVPSGGC